MDLSAKMPATQNSTLPSRMESKMTSEAAPTGGDGPAKAPMLEISRDSQPQDAEWTNLNEVGEPYMNGEKKTGPADGYSLDDRKEANVGGFPQRDAQ